MLAAACGDATAPVRSESNLSAASESNLSTVSASAAARGRHVRVQRELFLIPAAGGIVHVGNFWLGFPANAVCNPLGSGYGDKYWDLPCKTLTTDFWVVASYWSENGEDVIEFAPDVRFDPSKEVTIWTFRPELVGEADLGAFDFSSWSYTGGRRSKHPVFDDDPSLVTHFDPATGKVWRRVLHFSGISISSGAIGEYGSSDY
jgi:hypothetical protein